ncbi:MAG: tRNA (adenosine(37)-N6)-threonylcarbamoyltransferase complex dimerization subunit type 1 TsaB [Clostridia bacterium]|nr:tRNA (adenosine(37)-N6)-threonylcarbamoyltransferase complex dimerization subunit type 1 TsaB [Clostridia bacterium]
MLLLSVDSSSQAATAALLSDGELLCEYTQNQAKTHSVKMLPMIEQMMADAELSFDDIDAFACGIGPGSFTGLRIGVATVLGLNNTLGKIAVPVTSLEALANNVNSFDGLVIPLVFAREEECFMGAFQNGEEIVSPCVMTLSEIVNFTNGKRCILVGDGAVKNKDYFKENLDCEFAFGRQNIISAASLGEIAYKKIISGKVKNNEKLIPLYLRKSQAEREYEMKHSVDK